MGKLTLAPSDLPRRWKALEDRVVAAEGAMQEMIEAGRKADAEIARLKAIIRDREGEIEFLKE